MAQVPGAAVGAPVIQTQSLIPLVERVGNQLELRKQREQARKDQINARWTDMLSEMDTNGLNTIQNQTVTNEHQQMMENYASALRANDGDLDYSQRINYLKSQNRIKASADRMRAANQNVLAINQEMKDKGYYKDELMMADVQNKLHVYDENLGEWVARDDVNPEEIAGMLRDARYIDGDKYFKNDLESFEKINIMQESQGPFNTRILSQAETRDVWQYNEDGTIRRGNNGEPIPDLPMLMEELVKDPDKRKIYQQLAQQAGQDLGTYLRERVLANTGIGQEYKRVIYPPRASASESRAARGQELQDNRNRVILNKLQGLFNQSPEEMATAVESDVPTPSGGLYKDVTKDWPWFIAKNTRPDEVLIDPKRPGMIFIREQPGEELIEVPQDQLPDYIQRIESFNTNNKGITDLGLREGFFDIEGQVNPAMGPQPEEEFTQQLRQEAEQLERHREALGNKYANIGKQLRGKQKILPSLTEEDAQKWTNEMNRDFGNARISFKTMEMAQDYGLTSRQVSNLRFEAVPGRKERVKIFSGDTEIAEVTPEEFKNIIEGTHPEFNMVIGADTIPTQEPEPDKPDVEVGTGEFDEF